MSANILTHSCSSHQVPITIAGKLTVKENGRPCIKDVYYNIFMNQSNYCLFELISHEELLHFEVF